MCICRFLGGMYREGTDQFAGKGTADGAASAAGDNTQ